MTVDDWGEGQLVTDFSTLRPVALMLVACASLVFYAALLSWWVADIILIVTGQIRAKNGCMLG